MQILGITLHYLLAIAKMVINFLVFFQKDIVVVVVYIRVHETDVRIFLKYLRNYIYLSFITSRINVKIMSVV